MSRKFNVYLEFSANVVIEAESPEEAVAKGSAMLESRSVYEDGKVDQAIDDAYLAGLESREHPMGEEPVKRKAFTLRDPDFNSDNDPEVVEEVKE